MLSREDIEARENQILAPYAIKSADSAGRDSDEPAHAYRTCFQRDRDRIIHCSSFRRLEYKTQVFVNHVGDNFRTRLTHTMEVAQIARSIARAMQLNEDFVEALGLAHDLGHTPFGHAGEQELNAIMADDGGFEHNWQSRRIVTVLENNFKGLNLTKEVAESIIKHRTIYDHAETDLQNSFLETQVVNLADEISYNCHDLDDGLASGILEVSDLEQLEIWQEASQRVARTHPDLKGRWKIKRMIVSVLNMYVTDLIATSEKNLADAGISSIADVHSKGKDLIGFSETMTARNDKLQSYLREKLYNNSHVIRMSNKAQRFLREIFQEYEQNMTSLPEDYQEWARQDDVGPKRAIADYIAGMTDRYAQEEYKKLFYPFT